MLVSVLYARFFLSILLFVLLVGGVIVYGDAPPLPEPPQDVFNSSRLLNLSAIVHWYYYEWWGPLSWVVVFLVPVSIFIKSRSVSLAIASLIILMGLLAAFTTEAFVRYVALVSIAFGTAVILYRVFYNPERQPGEL